MKCFIHNAVEASASCRTCGKGMCLDCSAYSNHTGVCPECRRTEYIAERNTLYGEIKSCKKSITWAIVVAVLILALSIIICVSFKSAGGLAALIVELWPVIWIVKKAVQCKPLLARRDWLTTEIDKLSKHLAVGSNILRA